MRHVQPGAASLGGELEGDDGVAERPRPLTAQQPQRFGVEDISDDDAELRPRVEGEAVPRLGREIVRPGR